LLFWTVPRCFEGGTVAVLASGPSMSQAAAEQVRAAGVPAIAINSTFRLAPWAWMLYAADIEWWQHKGNADARRFAGIKATCTTGVATCRDVPDMRYLRNSGAGGFDPQPDSVRTGGNSGYQAVHIAVHTGAARILLCGMDMHGCHWHGPHPRDLRTTTADMYERWRARFGDLAKELKRCGVDVINVTPGSRLECFRRSTLESELATCAEPAAAEPALQA
jgi:hypothetical protein